MAQNSVHYLPRVLINENNSLFVEGCARAGFHAEQFPLNLKGCKGSSLCNLGCPNAAKMGTNRVQLPNAEAAGVEVVTRAEVLRLEDHAAIVRITEKAPGRKGVAIGVGAGRISRQSQAHRPLRRCDWHACLVAALERSRPASSTSVAALRAIPRISWSRSMIARSRTTSVTRRVITSIVPRTRASCSRRACTSRSSRRKT